MSYSIIFETKIVKLSDGRLLHLSLQGCNNDDCGRSRDDWQGKIYTRDNFIKYAEGFMQNSRPAKETGEWDLKIGSRYCTMYDYGKHLFRMMNRAVTLDELQAQKCVSFNGIDGVTVFEKDTETKMTIEEFNTYRSNISYGEGISYRYNYISLKTEKDIAEAFDNGYTVRIYIGK